MKGLIFNLLDSMARNSGCADEAWDLVMEFVASETEHDAETDTCLSCFETGEALPAAFETPAEAMIQCLGADSTNARESLSEFPELSLSSETEDSGVDPVAQLLDTELCANAAVSPEGFSHDLLTLLEQLLAEALTGDSEDDVDAEETPSLTAALSRRTSH
ncbi:MAG TPA: hypothetical protein VG963_19200 [Polyangiaceae bacterium]|nr:hypothetical protein [Polyangiaceae bacterium]